MIMNGQAITLNKSFDDTDAVTTIHDLTLNKEQMRVVKRYMAEKGVFFQTPTSYQNLEKS